VGSFDLAILLVDMLVAVPTAAREFSAHLPRRREDPENNVFSPLFVCLAIISQDVCITRVGQIAPAKALNAWRAVLPTLRPGCTN
jgi:hypothetical protein